MKDKTVYGVEDNEMDDGYVITAIKKGLEVFHCGEDTEQIVVGWKKLLGSVPKRELKAELLRRRDNVENQNDST